MFLRRRNALIYLPEVSVKKRNILWQVVIIGAGAAGNSFVTDSFSEFSGLYCKCFTIVIYDNNDSGQYYKTTIVVKASLS